MDWSLGSLHIFASHPWWVSTTPSWQSQLPRTAFRGGLPVASSSSWVWELFITANGTCEFLLVPLFCDVVCVSCCLEISDIVNLVLFSWLEDVKQMHGRHLGFFVGWIDSTNGHGKDRASASRVPNGARHQVKKRRSHHPWQLANVNHSGMLFFRTWFS